MLSAKSTASMPAGIGSAPAHLCYHPVAELRYAVNQQHETETYAMKDGRAHTAPVDWERSSLGERIEHICRLRGWSLNRLGEEAGYASGVMSRLSRRTATTAGQPDTLARIANAAGINVLWLLYGQGPVERVEHHSGALRNHPNWPAALAEAKKWQRGIPDEFWELAGDTVFPSPPRLDWNLVVGLVRELYSAHLRWREEADQRGAPAEGEESTPPEQSGTTHTRGASRSRSTTTKK